MVPQTMLRPGPDRGLRPVDLNRDLGQIAGLMELVFGGTMDAEAHAAMREMRALAHSGPWLWLLSRMEVLGEGFAPGFVWIEDQHIVGNVSVRRLESNSQIWLIGNVGVHPNYRRRGIARELMLAALELAEDVGGRWIALQVESENDSAIALYRLLGFSTVGTVNQWLRPADVPFPTYRQGQARIRLRRPDEWLEDWRLTQAVWPAGVQDIEPIRPGSFRSGFWESLADFLSGRRREFWAISTEDRLGASLHVRSRLGADEHWLSLAVRPELQGQVEVDLVVHGLRRLRGSRSRAVRVEHPAGDLAAQAALRELQFRQVRGLDTMRRPLGRRR